MKRRDFKIWAAMATAIIAVPAAVHSTPVITNVVETGGYNEATDTITAKYTGQTFTNGVPGEFLNPYTVPLFGEDAYAFVDRPHQWNGITVDMPLPSYLVGGEYIMIGNDNRDKLTYRLDISVSEPVLVYLLIDNRMGDASPSDPPEFGAFPTDWVTITWPGTEGYTPVMTGLNRIQDPSWPDEVGIDGNGDGVGPGASIQDYASVYMKTVEAGTFSVFESNTTGQNIYGVVVKRVPGSINEPPHLTDLYPTNNTLFADSTGGLHFTANTTSPNNIATSGIHLALNGTDVTSGLTIGGTGTARTVSYGSLLSNTVYNAQIIVADQAGRATTNELVFDTLNEANALTIEAEDYNYAGGSFNQDAGANSYASLQGLPEIDYHDNNTIVTDASYRFGDFTAIGTANDLPRSQFEGGYIDYTVTSIEAGEWLNYTRNFAGGEYQVFLRSSAGSEQEVELDRVSGAATSSQTAVALGTFKVPATANTYTPLTDASGNPVTVSLSGEQTLRLMALGGRVDLQLNYLVLEPVNGVTQGAYASVVTPANGATGVRPDTGISIAVSNGDTGVNSGSVSLKFDGNDVTSSAVINNTADGVAISYDPAGLLETNTAYTVSLVFEESGGTSVTNGWSFMTVPFVTPIPPSYGTAAGTGEGDGFNIHIVKVSDAAGTGTPPALPNTISRAEQELAGTLIDPTTLAPYENEAAGTDGTGRTTAAVINFDQLAVPTGYFGEDAAFPNIDPGLYDPAQGPNNIAMEATAYLELSAGIHRLGVRSDDGFKVTLGPVFGYTNLVLGVLEGGRGNGLPGGATEFDIAVAQSGLYPVRLIWFEGNGGASVEFYSVDPYTHERVLINDPNVPGAIQAYTERTTELFTPEVAITGPSNGDEFPNLPTNVTVTATATERGSTISKVEFIEGATKLGEATGEPYSIVLNNIEPGPHTITAVGTDARGFATVSPGVRFTAGVPYLRVNFQAPTTVTPEGYLADLGDVYGDRGNGYNYGWDADNTANGRERNNVSSPDKRYDTFTHMQKTLPAGRVWEMEVPNGSYVVFAVAGDPDSTDSVYDLQFEGQTIATGVPTTDDHFARGKGKVTVTDGKLTLSSGPTASNNKIAFFDLYAAGAAQGEAPELQMPTVSGNGVTFTWTGGGVLQETTDLASPDWTEVAGNPQGTYTVAPDAPRKFYRVVVP
jgi:hypothetical protein